MRLFFAYRVPEAVWPTFESVQQELRQRLSGIRAAWVRPEQLHATLRFLGEVEEGSAEALIAGAREVARVQMHFRVGLSELGCFRTGRRMRGNALAIWAGLEGVPDSGKALANALGNRLKVYCERPPAVEFVAHVTLCRAKHLRTEDEKPVQEALESIALPSGVEWCNGTFELIQSVAVQDGHRYETLAVFQLRDQNES